MNKKGAITDLVILIFVIFGFVLFTGLLIFVTKQVGNVFENDYFNRGTERNMTELFGEMFSALEDTYANINNWAMLVFFALIITFFISNAFIKVHPAWAIPYFIVIGISVIASVFIANHYENFLLNLPTELGESFAYLEKPSQFILKLPYIITIVGFIGAILLLIRIDWSDYGGY